jgi:lipoyl(octanoyl) transferase
VNAPPIPPCPVPRDALRAPLHATAGAAPVEWRVSAGLIDYEAAVAEMESRVARIAAGEAPEFVWLLEHPPVYTAGTSARDADLLDPRFPVHRTGRGGQFTYHGPGQRVGYVLLDLARRRRDARAYVCGLESWLIETLADFGVAGERREARVGVWVKRPEKPHGLSGEIAEDKIAAIGVRLRQWVSFHGIALNVAPDLTHFGGIAPCGVRESHLGVTSLADLGVTATMAEVDAALKRRFEGIFGGTVVA